MAFVFSQEFKNKILVDGSAKDVFDGAFLSIYSGPAPTVEYGYIGQPDPENNTLLVTYTSDGVPEAGLLLADAPTEDGLLLKHPGHSWVGVAVAEGTGGFFQITHPDFYDPIIQGTCGTVESSADLRLDSVSFALNTAYAINYFSLSL